jgi:hypothetical protein
MLGQGQVRSHTPEVKYSDASRSEKYNTHIGYLGHYEQEAQSAPSTRTKSPGYRKPTKRSGRIGQVSTLVYVCVFVCNHLHSLIHSFDTLVLSHTHSYSAPTLHLLARGHPTLTPARTKATPPTAIEATLTGSRKRSPMLQDSHTHQ